VNQDSAWRQSTQDAYRGVEYFARAFTGSYAESGQRSGHLSQQDAIVADRAIERDASRMIEGVRSEVFSGYRDSQERLDGLETRQDVKLGEGREVATAQVSEEASATVSALNRTQVSTRGVMGPSGGSLVAGLAFSR
jgi:hypothetical protein